MDEVPLSRAGEVSQMKVVLPSYMYFNLCHGEAFASDWDHLLLFFGVWIYFPVDVEGSFCDGVRVC